jgi:hypothetical protein
MLPPATIHHNLTPPQPPTTTMSLLSSIHKGPQARPHLVGLYGPGGVGKSTFAASAPAPVFLGTDDGVGTLDVASFPIPERWVEVMQAIRDLTYEKHDYETLVIDTINGLEPLLWAHICKEANCTSIEEVDGGYGKGYVRAMEQWVEFWKAIKSLRKKMHVIGLGHAETKTIEHIEDGERFDRYVLKMHQRSAALFHESVDCMFFANFKTYFNKKKGAMKARATSTGERRMFTEERPAFLAKSRFDLPFEMPLSWTDFAAAASKQVTSATPDQLAAVLKGREETATRYFVSLGWIPEGATWKDLPAAKRKPVMNRAKEFQDALDKFEAAENETEPETTNE